MQQAVEGQTDHAYYPLVRALTAACYLGLLLALGYGAWFYGPDTAASRLALWLFGAIGLLLVLPGLLRQSRRSYQWLCFILLMYFVWCVPALFAAATGYKVAAMVFIVGGFCASMFAARGRRRE